MTHEEAAAAAVSRTATDAYVNYSGETHNWQTNVWEYPDGTLYVAFDANHKVVTSTFTPAPFMARLRARLGW
jgi:hypothetical protein